MLKQLVGRLRQSLPSKAEQVAQKGNALSEIKNSIEAKKNSNIWEIMKSKIPDTSNVIESSTDFISTRASKLETTTKQGLQTAQKKVADKTIQSAKYLQNKSMEGIGHVQRKAMDTSTKGVQYIQDKTIQASHRLVSSAKQGAFVVHENTTKKLTDAGAAVVRSSKESIGSSLSTIQKTSAAIVGNATHIDPRAQLKRLRNQVLLLVFSGIFVYGFASSMPSAIAMYAAEVEKSRVKAIDSKDQ